MSKRHNISIRHNVYLELQQQGKFGESFSDLITRIMRSHNVPGEPSMKDAGGMSQD